MVNLALQLTNWGGGGTRGEEEGEEKGESREVTFKIYPIKEKKRVFLRAAAVAMVTLTPNPPKNENNLFINSWHLIYQFQGHKQKAMKLQSIEELLF